MHALPQRRRAGILLRSLAMLLAGTLSSLPAAAAESATGSHSSGWRLRFVREGPALACPDEEALRDGLRRRLGRDPFGGDPAGSRELEVRLTGAGTGLQARLVLHEADGWAAGERTLRSRGQDCAELFGAAQLAVAIALDPLQQLGGGAAGGEPFVSPVAPGSLLAPLPVPLAPVFDTEAGAVAPVVPLATLPSAGPQPPSTPGLDPGWRFAFGGGAAGSFGSTPAPGLGVLVRGAGSGPGWTVALDGRFERGAARALDGGGELLATLWSGALAGCLDRGLLGACAVVAAGGLSGATTGVSRPRTGWLPQLAVGVRGRVGWRWGDRLVSELWGDLLLPAARPALLVGDQQVWRGGPLVGTAGLALLVEWPRP